VWNDIKYDILLVRKLLLLVRKLVLNCWCITKEIKEKLYKDVIMMCHSSSASHDDFIRFMKDIIEKLLIKECIVLY